MGEWIQTPQVSGFKSLGVIDVASHATANTMGSWVEIVASTEKDIFMLVFQTRSDIYLFLAQIGIGTAGSEVAISGYINVSCSTNSGLGVYDHIFLPIFIPAGTRVSVRTQSNSPVGAKTLFTFIYALYKGDWSRDQIYGVRFEAAGNTADSGGIQIDPGGSADTKGSYSEIIASTTFLSRGIILQFGDLLNTTRSTCWWAVDISIGAAGSEVVIIPDFVVGSRSENDTVHPKTSPLFPISVPAGTRIAARAKCDITDATDRLLDVSVGVIG